MKKILEVIYRFDHGGIEAFILNCIDNLDLSKYKLDIYVYGASSSPHMDYLRKKGVNVHFEPENDIANNHIFRFIRKLVVHIRRGKYDVVHAHCNLISAWVVFAAWLCRVPIRITHAHSARHETKRHVQRLWCKVRRLVIKMFATHRVACGRLSGESMYGLKEEYTIVLNGIDISKFQTAEQDILKKLKHEFKIPGNARVYANISRMDTQKNHPFMVEVMNEIHKKDPQAIFLIGGTIPSSGSTYDKVLGKIKEYHMESCTRITGPRADLAAIYHLVDCWIFPSSYEGLPFMPLELQAASVPCIVSDVVTKEIDLDLGLVEFLSLKESPAKWAELAMNKQKSIIDGETLKDAFKEHGFDLYTNIEKLKFIYDS